MLDFERLDYHPGIEFGGCLSKARGGRAWQPKWEKHAFNTVSHHKFDSIYAVVDPENTASLKWLPKLGMKRVPEKDGIFLPYFYSLF
ncbi:MAG: hypothetical protein R2877_05480 [Bdellovibrionota bacterium]